MTYVVCIDRTLSSIAAPVGTRLTLQVTQRKLLYSLEPAQVGTSHPTTPTTLYSPIYPSLEA